MRSHRCGDPTLLRRGDWLPVRHGVYVDAELWAGLDPFRGQPLLRIRAAGMCLRCRDYVVQPRLRRPVPRAGRPRSTYRPRPRVTAQGPRRRHPGRGQASSRAVLARRHRDRRWPPPPGARPDRAGHGTRARPGRRRGLLRCRTASGKHPVRSTRGALPHVVLALQHRHGRSDRAGRRRRGDLAGVRCPGARHGSGLRPAGDPVRALGRHAHRVVRHAGGQTCVRGRRAPQVRRGQRVRSATSRGPAAGEAPPGLHQRVQAGRLPHHRARLRRWSRAAEQRLAREVDDTNARFGTDISDLAPYIVRRRRR